jgi:hypothetical protein
LIPWAAKWSEAVSDKSTPEPTRDYFSALGREPRVAPWQFQQCVRAVAWFARDILHLPWAAAFDWHALTEAAQPLERDHRTHARETIRVSASLQAAPTCLPVGVRAPAHTVSTLAMLSRFHKGPRGARALYARDRVGRSPLRAGSRGARALYANIHSSASSGLVTPIPCTPIET